MDYFSYQNGELFAENVPLATIAKEQGTPCYVYSRKTIERHWDAFDSSFADYPHLVCYAVKASSSLAILNILARKGSGFDIVSGGELLRVLEAGGSAEKIVFSGVGKTVAEIGLALDKQIHCFNVESAAELDRLCEIAQGKNVIAPIAIRVNPDVDANTHPYISTGLKENKFGVSISEAKALYQKVAEHPHIKIKGIACHIGSQLTELRPFLDALDRVLALVDSLKQLGINLNHLDIGGGLGVNYQDEQPPQPQEYAEAILAKVRDTGYEIHIEPGRAIMANAGMLLSEVLYVKENEGKNFVVVDAAMNDLMRPALYSAWQKIIPVKEQSQAAVVENADVVGPVCETGDFLGKRRDLAVSQGDLVAVRSAGAYGFSMSSNYNTRARAAEVMVDGDRYYVIRKREDFSQMIAGESLLPE